MRYDDRHKESVRSRIVREAARALRGTGIDGIGIPGLMRRAGLTHGGFYRHFRSRSELVAEALRAASDETTPRLFGAALNAVEPLKALLETYLDPRHRLHPERGCPLAALGAEAPRQDPAVRRAFSEIAVRFLRNLDPVVRGAAPEPGKEPDDETLAIAAAMIGALMLSRMVLDEALADRVLAATRAFVLRSRGTPTR